MPIKIGLLGLLMLVCSLKTNAQEDVLFTNKQLKMNYMNPAYIPEIMKATFTIGGRYQWTGIDGAPRSIYANGKYFFMGAHSQISLSFLSDDIGYQYTRQPKIGYAFMLPIGDDSYLNLGIGGGLVNRGYDASKIDPANTKNMEDSYDLQKGTAPDAEVGAEVLLQNLEIGASVNHLLEGTENVKMSPLYSGYVNYYLYLCHQYEKNSGFLLQPDRPSAADSAECVQASCRGGLSSCLQVYRTRYAFPLPVELLELFSGFSRNASADASSHQGA
jgi:type IX secretion system PorP/SprF family membrane protein